SRSHFSSHVTFFRQSTPIAMQSPNTIGETTLITAVSGINTSPEPTASPRTHGAQAPEELELAPEAEPRDAARHRAVRNAELDRGSSNVAAGALQRFTDALDDELVEDASRCRTHLHASWILADGGKI